MPCYVFSCFSNYFVCISWIAAKLYGVCEEFYRDTSFDLASSHALPREAPNRSTSMSEKMQAVTSRKKCYHGLFKCVVYLNFLATKHGGQCFIVASSWQVFSY